MVGPYPVTCPGGRCGDPMRVHPGRITTTAPGLDKGVQQVPNRQLWLLWRWNSSHI